MTILELREMTKREYALWFSNAKATDLKEVLNNENLGGGISKFTKAMLIEVVMDLVDNVETELTSKLKPKRINKKRVYNKNINGKDTKQQDEVNEDNKDNVEQSDKEYWAEENTKNLKAIEDFKKKCEEGNLCEEEIMYEEMMLPYNKQDFSAFYMQPLGTISSQSGYFTYGLTKKEARTKYLKLVKYYHPDKSTGDEEKFKNIQEAWEKAQIKFDLEEED